MTDPKLLLGLLILLGVANGAPIIATKLLGGRLAAPLDGGLILADGQPLFGASKTIRGVVVSIASTTLAAPLAGLAPSVGAWLAATSLAGDLCSSFVKRRLGQPVHAQAVGLDQIPEALLPLIALQGRLGLNAIDIALLIAAFVGLEILLSRLLFKLRIRDRPY